MSRELTEFSDLIDERFDAPDDDTIQLWLFIIGLFE